MHARLLGLDLQNEGEFDVPEEIIQRRYVEKAAHKPLAWQRAEPSDEYAPAFFVIRYRLTYVLGVEDGGPLAVFHREP
jgi:hypothetical protein